MDVTMNVTDEQLRDLLTTAFEGGVGYWCSITGYEYPEGKGRADVDFPHCDLPLLKGGAVVIEDLEDETHRVTREALARGLSVMAGKYPRHMLDFVGQNEDAETGDVFLQCCVFGEIVYG